MIPEEAGNLLLPWVASLLAHPVFVGLLAALVALPVAEYAVGRVAAAFGQDAGSDSVAGEGRFRVRREQIDRHYIDDGGIMYRGSNYTRRMQWYDDD